MKLSFFLSFFLIVNVDLIGQTKVDSSVADANISQEELISNLFPINFKNDNIELIQDKSVSINKELFHVQIDFSKHIIKNNISFYYQNVEYLNCSIYFYTFEDTITNLAVSKKYELGIIHSGNLIVKLQTNDLTSFGTFYRQYSLIEQSILSEFEFEIYPNPSSGLINLFSSNIKIETLKNNLQFFNITGEEITPQIVNHLNSLEIKFNPSTKKGIYFLRLNLKDKIITKKIVIS